MKNCLLLSICIFISTAVVSQVHFTAEASQLFTTFKFKDSKGVNHDAEYQSLITGAYGIGLRYVTDGGLMFRVGVNMRNGGANLVYENTNYSWKLQYLDFKGGIGYMAQFKYIKPYLTVMGYYAPLLRGIQTHNNESFNITKNKILNNSDYGLQFNPGLNIRINEGMSTYIEFNYLLGLSNLEVSAQSPQKSGNSAFGATVGFSISLEAKN